MCGSNAAGEPLPMHIMFSSTAGSEENFQVRADWVARLPSVKVKFGMNLVTVIGPTLTVNSKGGSDSRTLYQECLMAYTTRLYPDCADVAGKQVLFKIDGGPGRLDMKLLADLRARGVYLFNGVQNTTQITQETDQNFSLFKSCVRRNEQKLLNEQVRKYNKAKREHNANPELFPEPTELPTLDRSHYGDILSGRDANEENDLCPLEPAFAPAFSKENNLRA